MFQIRKDLYERRERADKLKIAFATAASLGAGLGSAWTLGELNGICFYTAGMLLLLGFHLKEKLDLPDEQKTYPFPEGQKIANRFAEKMGIQAPLIRISYEVQHLNAQPSERFIEMGLGYDNPSRKAHTEIVIGHEMAHLKNKDMDIRVLIFSSGFSLIPCLAFLTSIRSAAALGMTLAMGYALLKAICRIQEFRADRLALLHLDSPLSIAVCLQEQEIESKSLIVESVDGNTKVRPPRWNEVYAPSRWQIWKQSHPSTADRIKALVQLCQRVPDAPSGGTGSLNHPPVP